MNVVHWPEIINFQQRGEFPTVGKTFLRDNVFVKMRIGCRKPPINVGLTCLPLELSTARGMVYAHGCRPCPTDVGLYPHNRSPWSAHKRRLWVLKTTFVGHEIPTDVGYGPEKPHQINLLQYVNDWIRFFYLKESDLG